MGSKLIADSVRQSDRDSFQGLTSHFIIVSSNRGLAELVANSITELGFPVHIWVWEKDSSKQYADYQCKLAHIHFLDHNLEETGISITTNTYKNT